MIPRSKRAPFLFCSRWGMGKPIAPAKWRGRCSNTEYQEGTCGRIPGTRWNWDKQVVELKSKATLVSDGYVEMKLELSSVNKEARMKLSSSGPTGIFIVDDNALQPAEFSVSWHQKQCKLAPQTEPRTRTMHGNSPREQLPGTLKSTSRNNDIR